MTAPVEGPFDPSAIAPEAMKPRGDGATRRDAWKRALERALEPSWLGTDPERCAAREAGEVPCRTVASMPDGREPPRLRASPGRLGEGSRQVAAPRPPPYAPGSPAGRSPVLVSVAGGLPLAAPGVAATPPPTPPSAGSGCRGAAWTGASSPRAAGTSLPLLAPALSPVEALEAIPEAPVELARAAAGEPPAGADAQGLSIRMHQEWNRDGLRVWLGVDAGAPMSPELLRTLLGALRRRAELQGGRLLTVVCNGTTIFEVAGPLTPVPRPPEVP